jgi:ABC-type transport system substrate-binding protein
LYQDNLEGGDYSLYPWPDMAGSDSWFRTNQTYNDNPDIGRALRTKNFRIALSLAMDREEVNEIVFLSLGTPGNMIPNPTTPYHPAEDPYRNIDAVRDVARANSLLDGLGYTDSDGDGTRNFPSGSNIELFLEINSDRWFSLGDILVSNFADIGIELEWAPDENEWRHFMTDNIAYLGVGGGHGNPNPFHAYPTGTVHGPGMVAGLIDQWLRDPTTGMGKTGPDPAYQPLAPAGTWPADSDGILTQLGEVLSGGQNFELLHPTRVAQGKEYFELGAEYKYNIGLVHFAPAFRGIMLKRNNFRNVVKHQNWDAIGFSMYQTYFEDGMDNMNNPGNKSKKYASESFLTGLTYD